MVNNKKIIVLQIEPVSGLGGVTHFIEHIVRFLPKKLFTIHFAASGKGETFSLLQKQGAVIHTTLVDYSFWNFFSAVVALRRIIKKENIDIIHAHTAKAGLLSVYAARGTTSKIIFTGHGWRFLQLQNLLKRSIIFLLERYITQHVSALTYLTKKEQKIGMSIVPEQLNQYVIPFSIDPGSYQLIPGTSFRKKNFISSEAFVVLMVGRITYQKDPQTFGRVANLILEKIPTARFVWVGEGERESLPSFVTITGHLSREGVAEAMKESNVLLFTSQFEGLPIVLLEAMTIGIPIIAANVSGIPEIIIEGITGELFEKSDAKSAAKKVLALYNDKIKIANYKENAIKRILRDFTPVEKTANSFAILYKKIYDSQY